MNNARILLFAFAVALTGCAMDLEYDCLDCESIDDYAELEAEAPVGEPPLKKGDSLCFKASDFGDPDFEPFDVTIQVDEVHADGSFDCTFYSTNGVNGSMSGKGNDANGPGWLQGSWDGEGTSGTFSLMFAMQGGEMVAVGGELKQSEPSKSWSLDPCGDQ